MSQLPLACGDRSGFLFAHACDRPATGACGTCGRPICIEHTRMGPSGQSCIACLRDPDPDRSSSSSDTGTSSSGSTPATDAAPGRGQQQGDFGGAGASAYWQQREGERLISAEPAAARPDDPYFFDGGPDENAYYDADDYRAFDAVTAAAAADSAGDAGEADAAPDTDTGAS